MESVSLAAGLVPLAVNIVHMSSAIQGRIRDYKLASDDIQLVIEKTILIGDICFRLDIDPDNAKQHDIEPLGRALKMCFESVSGVHKDLDRVTKISEGRKRSIKYVFSKPDIEKSLCKLNESISMLNTCLCWSVWKSCQETAQKLSSPPVAAVAKEIARRPKSTGIAARRFRPVAKSTNTTSAHSNALFTYSSTNSSAQGDDGFETVQHTSYFFGVRLLGKYISLAIQSGPLSPLTWSLDMPQCVYEVEFSEAFEAIARGPGRGREKIDDKAVASWARKWKVTPNMQLIFATGRRLPLLGAMVSTDQPEAFTYLLNFARGPFREDLHYTGDVRGLSHRRPLLYDVETALSYLNIRGPLLTTDEYVRLLCRSFNPGDFRTIFRKSKELFSDDWELFESETWCALVTTIQRVPFLLEKDVWDSLRGYGHHVDNPIRDWGDIVSDLTANGLLHRLEPCSRTLALRQMFDKNTLHLIQSRLDVVRRARLWLHVLDYAGVCLESYLQMELDYALRVLERKQTYPGQWLQKNLEEKVKFLLDLCLESKPWLMAQKDDRPGIVLLDAMPALAGDEVKRLWSPGTYGVCSHLDWKTRRSDSVARAPVWPFLVDSQDKEFEERVGYKNVSRSVAESIASYQVYRRLIEERFYRQQERKWRKLKKRNTSLRDLPAMPGSWAMDWWEYRGPW